MRRVLRVVVSALLLASCGKKSDTPPAAAAPEVNQRRLDTAISRSRLPGARGVGDAMTATDRANAQTRMQDSLSELLNR